MVLLHRRPGLAEKPNPVYPVTYSTPSPDEQFLFVMLAPPSGDATQNPDNNEHAKELRKKYPQSGMYRNDGSTDPLWAVDWYDYEVFPANDGIHLVRERRLGPAFAVVHREAAARRTEPVRSNSTARPCRFWRTGRC